MWAKSWHHCDLWFGFGFGNSSKLIWGFSIWQPDALGLMFPLKAMDFQCPRGLFGGVQVTPIAIRF